MNTITLEKFKAFKSPCNLQLDGKNALFFGENGSGKSSIYDAIKIAFHRQKVFSELIPAGVVLPADRTARENDIINSYNHQKTPLSPFSLNINGNAYNSFPTVDYDVNLINADDIAPRDVLEADTLIQSANINIADATRYVTNNKADIEDLLNSYIKDDFHEPNIKLTLNMVNSKWRVALQDAKRMSAPVSENLRASFNEAKLRIISFLILTIALQANDRKHTATHHILVLDDVIGSMDSANRTFLVKYIHDYLSTYQLIVFTHSASYYNIVHYSFTKVWNNPWNGFHIIEKDGDAEVVKVEYKSTRKIKNGYRPGRNENITGNAIRQRFEFLVAEFSKLVCVGGISEAGVILDAINSSNNIYYKWNAANDTVLTIYDLIKEITDVVTADTSGSPLSTQLNSVLSSYKANADIIQIKNALSELMVYQKISLNPTSHSTGFVPMTTQQEIMRSLALMFKFEEYMNKLVGRDIYSY